jgi:steroid 5-alpha reductase family enzyme
MTQLTAINIAKFITILCLIIFALIYGVHDYRQVLYLCLHISYCLWWLLEQWLFPQRRQQLFTEQVSISAFIGILLFVGVFYSLPGYLAFTNTNPIDYLTVAIALPLYIFGSLINTGADVQKMVAKSMGGSLVDDGIWRSVRHINYLASLLDRYGLFCYLARSLYCIFRG